MPPKCYICKSSTNNRLELGEFKTTQKFSVHYFCLLLSSGLVQQGEDDEGILGFLPKDIEHEVQRVAEMKCFYCNQYYANIGCCHSKCYRAFHIICGIDNKCNYEFMGTYRSYCKSHTKEFNRAKHAYKEQCVICLDDIGKYNSVTSILAPCCRGGWFHKLCLMQYSVNAGYFLKCPLCNNVNRFRDQVSRRGIFIPDIDATWETEPNAYEDLLERPNTCEAIECVCPRGRDYDSNSYEIQRCGTCGSHCMHKQCWNKKEPFICNECECIDNVNNRTVETHAPDDAENNGHVSMHAGTTSIDSPLENINNSSQSLRSDNSHRNIPHQRPYTYFTSTVISYTETNICTKLLTIDDYSSGNENDSKCSYINSDSENDNNQVKYIHRSYNSTKEQTQHQNAESIVVKSDIEFRKNEKQQSSVEISCDSERYKDEASRRVTDSSAILSSFNTRNIHKKRLLSSSDGDYNKKKKKIQELDSELSSDSSLQPLSEVIYNLKKKIRTKQYSVLSSDETMYPLSAAEGRSISSICISSDSDEYTQKAITFISKDISDKLSSTKKTQNKTFDESLPLSKEELRTKSTCSKALSESDDIQERIIINRFAKNRLISNSEVSQSDDSFKSNISKKVVNINVKATNIKNKKKTSTRTTVYNNKSSDESDATSNDHRSTQHGSKSSVHLKMRKKVLHLRQQIYSDSEEDTLTSTINTRKNKTSRRNILSTDSEEENAKSNLNMSNTNKTNRKSRSPINLSANNGKNENINFKSKIEKISDVTTFSVQNSKIRSPTESYQTSTSDDDSTYPILKSASAIDRRILDSYTDSTMKMNDNEALSEKKINKIGSKNKTITMRPMPVNNESYHTSSSDDDSTYPILKSANAINRRILDSDTDSTIKMNDNEALSEKKFNEISSKNKTITMRPDWHNNESYQTSTSDDDSTHPILKSANAINRRILDSDTESSLKMSQNETSSSEKKCSLMRKNYISDSEKEVLSELEANETVSKNKTNTKRPVNDTINKEVKTRKSVVTHDDSSLDSSYSSDDSECLITLIPIIKAVKLCVENKIKLDDAKMDTIICDNNVTEKNEGVCGAFNRKSIEGSDDEFKQNMKEHTEDTKVMKNLKIKDKPKQILCSTDISSDSFHGFTDLSQTNCQNLNVNNNSNNSNLHQHLEKNLHSKEDTDFILIESSDEDSEKQLIKCNQLRKRSKSVRPTTYNEKYLFPNISAPKRKRRLRKKSNSHAIINLYTPEQKRKQNEKTIHQYFSQSNTSGSSNENYETSKHKKEKQETVQKINRSSLSENVLQQNNRSLNQTQILSFFQPSPKKLF